MSKPIASIVIRQQTGLTDLRDLTPVQSALTNLFDQFVASKTSLPTKEIRERCRYQLHQSQHEVKILLFPGAEGQQDAEDLFGGSLGHDLSRLILECFRWCASDQSAREEAERNHVVPEYKVSKGGKKQSFVFDERENKVLAPSHEALQLVETCRDGYRRFVVSVVGNFESGEWSISIDGEGLVFKRPIKISSDLKVEDEASGLVTIKGKLKRLDHPLQKPFGRLTLVDTELDGGWVVVEFPQRMSADVMKHWGRPVRITYHEKIGKKKAEYVLETIERLQGELAY